MRTKVKLKGGISLIVLVITIIVMIILAAAIILSLSNSGIISKANKAKTDSDTANLKEYVNTLRAEWELMTADEQTVAGSFVEYANKKLAEKGYKRELTEDGKTVMNEAATAAVKAGIKVGDTINGYIVTETTYTTDGSERNWSGTNSPQTITTNTDIAWKYLGINANGELEIMSVLSEVNTINNTDTKRLKVTLRGKGGYLNGPNVLNAICKELYSKDGVGTARSMNIDDINNILGYTGPKGSYRDIDSNKITTALPQTIATLESELGTRLSGRTTPDGKDIATYYSDLYYISSLSTDIKNTDKKSLVFNSKNTSWLASRCVHAMFDSDCANFNVYFVSSNYVTPNTLFTSSSINNSADHAVRPVVTLDPSVTLTKDSSAQNTWNISK